MTEKKRNTIITIGLQGFPYGMATTQKLMMMGKSVMECGYDFTVISNTFIKKEKINEKLTKRGKIEGVTFFTTSPYVFSPRSLVEKLYGKVAGLINEFFYVIRMRRRNELKAIFIYSMSFWYAIFWSFFSKIIKVPVYLVYFELRSTCSNRKGVFNNFNDNAFDKYAIKYVDGIITISDNLISHIQRNAPKVKYIKVPPLVDFDIFKVERSQSPKDYFLFCGSLAYVEVVEFIIESYKRIKVPHNTQLYLVVNGPAAILEKIKTKLSEEQLDARVKVFNGLSYTELVKLYVNAKALLIPLRDSPQDISRFPQKVAEYCAASRPIISTNLGEMRNYFDASSAVLVEKYDVDEFAGKMQFVIENGERCEAIALNGYATGKKHFDYRSYARVFNDFLKF